MKWIWFLLFLAIVGEIMDTMEFADAAKKKRKKKITKKKKKAKAKAKKKPGRRTTTTRRPVTGFFDPSKIFYSPVPILPSNFNGPDNNSGAIPYNLPISGPDTNYTALPVANDNLAVVPMPGIREQSGLNKNGWHHMIRQKRFIDENPLVLEHLGLIDSGKIKEFGLDRPKRNIRMLKVASSRVPPDNVVSVDENNNISEVPQTESRRRRAVDSKEELKRMQAKQQENPDTLRNRQEEIKNQLGRPKRELADEKIKDKIKNRRQDMQSKRDELNDKLSRPKRDVIQNNKDKTQAKRDEIKDKTKRPKRDIKTQVEKAKEKIETRRQRQEEKRKEKKEKQETKRSDRRQRLNATRIDIGANRPQIKPLPSGQEGPTFEAQVMPHDISNIRLKRYIDAAIPSLQTLTLDEDDDSSMSEECVGEDCSLDESCEGADCFDDSDENLTVVNSTEHQQFKFKRETPKDSRRDSTQTYSLPKEGLEIIPPRPKRQAEGTSTPTGQVNKDSSGGDCIGDDCSSEECIGDDCTYEDSDSEESAELTKIVAKRQVNDEDAGRMILMVREKREIGRPKYTGSAKQTNFAVGCDGSGTDYGSTDNYGDYDTDDYTEERRRRRNQGKNNRHNNNRNNHNSRRSKNNRRNNRRNNKRNRTNRRNQSSTSFDQATRSPFVIARTTPASGLSPYLPFNAGITPSSIFGMNSEPSLNVLHTLRKREVYQRATTLMPRRTTVFTGLDRQRRELQGMSYSLPGQLLVEIPYLKVEDVTPILNDFANSIPPPALNPQMQAMHFTISVPNVGIPGVLSDLANKQSAYNFPEQHLHISGRPKREALNNKPERQRKGPKEGKQENSPPTNRMEPQSKGQGRSKRDALSNRPENQPRTRRPSQESRQLESPSTQRPERQRKASDRQKRELDSIPIIQSSMPMLIPPDIDLTANKMVGNYPMPSLLPEMQGLPIHPTLPGLKVKRQAPDGQSKQQRPRPEGKQRKGPPIDRTQSDRQKRELNKMTIMHSPVPMSSTPYPYHDELVELWKDINSTMQWKMDIPITDGLLMSIPFEPNPTLQPPIVKREASNNRVEVQPKGPRNNPKENQGKRSPSVGFETGKVKREAQENMPEGQFNIPNSNPNGNQEERPPRFKGNTMIENIKRKAFADKQVRQPKEQRPNHEDMQERRPQSDRPARERPDRQRRDINSMSFMQSHMPKNETSLDDLELALPVEPNNTSTFNSSVIFLQNSDIKVKRQVPDSKGARPKPDEHEDNQGRRPPSDSPDNGNNKSEREDHPNRPNSPNRNDPNGRPKENNPQGRPKRSANAEEILDGIQNRMATSELSMIILSENDNDNQTPAPFYPKENLNTVF